MMQADPQQYSKRGTAERKPMLNYGDIPIPTEPVETVDFERDEPFLGTMDRKQM